MEQGRNQIDKEIAENWAHYVEQSWKRQYRTQNTNYRSEDHVSKVEDHESFISDISKEQLNYPCSADLHHNWEGTHNPQKEGNFHYEDCPFSQVAVNKCVFAVDAWCCECSHHWNHNISDKSNPISNTEVSDIFVLTLVLLHDRNYKSVDWEGQGTGSNQISNVERKPVELV